MSRRLIVMRHAKSSWKEPYGSDHERPLKGRGQREAARAAEEIFDSGWSRTMVWSSISGVGEVCWFGTHRSVSRWDVSCGFSMGG